MNILDETTLIISPHPDDEVLGCGGIISSIKDKGKLHILYITNFHPLFAKEEYNKERLNLISYLGCNEDVLIQTESLTNKLDTYPISCLINSLEEKINKIKPTNIFVCFPSYNQDHRIVFDALITATRPHDRNHFVKNIFVYEQPETLHTQRLNGQFTPNFFAEIDIEKKIELYKFYNTQQRGHRDSETLRALARLRGSYIAKPYAESFQTIRFTL